MGIVPRQNHFQGLHKWLVIDWIHEDLILIFDE